MVSASAFLTRGGLSFSYWWKVTMTCEWSKRIMLVMVGLSLFRLNIVTPFVVIYSTW